MNDPQIESILRKVPGAAAPPGLKHRLLSDIRLPRLQTSTADTLDVAPLWRRWFPAFAVGLLFLGCLIVLGVQTSQMVDLRRKNAALQSETANIEALRRDNAELKELRARSRGAEQQKKDGEELLKLKAEVGELRDQARELATLRAENQRLRGERAALLAQASVAPADDPFARLKEKSNATQCVNNLKQIGLAGRMWANDHNTNVLPIDWLAMKKELPTPKLLTCPGDATRSPATTWDQFDGSSVSYELPSAAPNENEPYTVYTRCRVHGSIGLTDGSAIMKVSPATQFEQIDGNLKLRSNATIGRKP